MTQDELTQLVIQKANQYGIPVSIALSQVQAESGFNPNAVSKAGASGLLQLMPGTANDLGVSNVFDPTENLDGGFRYLAALYKKYGDWSLALAGYNAGPGNVDKYGGVPPFSETQKYIDTVLSNAGMLDSTDIGSDTTDSILPGLGTTLLVVGGIAMLALLSK